MLHETFLFSEKYSRTRDPPTHATQFPDQQRYNRAPIPGCFCEEGDASPIATEPSVDWPLQATEFQEIKFNR